jgi:glycerol-3-phosphate dehydrogenase subunit B
MRDMYGGYAAANLRAAGFDVKAVTVEIDAFRARRPQTTVVAARMLEDPDFQRQLIGSVRPHAPGAVRIGFPAVLGVERHREVVRTLAEGLGAPVFEISTLPPSVPGLRMFEALRRRLLGMKVQVEIGAEVTERVTDGDRLVAVGTVSASRLRYYRAGAVVLATGGILGGGLSGRRDGTVTEVALGLPVRAPERGEWFHARVFDGHPIFRAGIQVNEHMQPVNADGQVVLRNVYAAGAILAGSDPWREKSHEGIALATGYRAVESAVNALSPATRASPR